MFSSDIDNFLDKMKQNFEKAISFLKQELASIKAGRANPTVLDRVFVDYYGTSTQLKQMANIATSDARTLTISLWDASALKDVNKAILAANIGLTPSDDGRVIRLVFPILTEERRKEIVKQIKVLGENNKITLRNERRDCLEACKKLKNDKLISEDDLAGVEKEVQKIIDSYTLLTDKLVSEKEKEVLTV